jgi:hypothetical protein
MKLIVESFGILNAHDVNLMIFEGFCVFGKLTDLYIQILTGF